MAEALGDDRAGGRLPRADQDARGGTPRPARRPRRVGRRRRPRRGHHRRRRGSSGGAGASTPTPESLRAAVADLEARGRDPQGGDRRGRQARRRPQAGGVRRCPPRRLSRADPRARGHRGEVRRPPRPRAAAGPRAPAAPRRRQPLPPRHRRRRLARHARGAIDRGRAGQRHPDRADRLRPARRPLGRGRSGRAPDALDRRRRAAPQRGAAPGRSGDLDAAMAEIEQLAGAHDKVRAVGETGLDHFRTGEDGPGGAGGELPPPHRPRQAPRQDARHPRPGRARRRAADHRRGGCARALGDALLLRRRRLRPRLPRPRRPPQLRRHGHLQERRAACATRSPSRRSTGSWSRPTRRTSRPRRSAAGPTRPTSSRTPCGRWPRCAETTSRRCARPSTHNTETRLRRPLVRPAVAVTRQTVTVHPNCAIEFASSPVVVIVL